MVSKREVIQKLAHSYEARRRWGAINLGTVAWKDNEVTIATDRGQKRIKVTDTTDTVSGFCKECKHLGKKGLHFIPHTTPATDGFDGHVFRDWSWGIEDHKRTCTEHKTLLFMHGVIRDINRAIFHS